MKVSAATPPAPDEACLDVFEILGILKSNSLKIILISILTGAAFSGLQYFRSTPAYVSRASILTSSADSGVNLSAISQFLPRSGAANSQLAQFERILKTQAIAAKVNQKLKQKNIQGKQIKFIVKSDSISLEIEFRATTAQYALAGAEAYLEALAEIVQEGSSAKARANEAFIKARLNEAETALAKFESRIPGMRLSEANREQQIQTKVVLLLREQYELAQIETKKQQQSFQVIDPPQLPGGPDNNWSLRPGFMVSFLMLFVTAAWFVALSYFLEEKRRRSRSRNR